MEDQKGGSEEEKVVEGVRVKRTKEREHSVTQYTYPQAFAHHAVYVQRFDSTLCTCTKTTDPELQRNAQHELSSDIVLYTLTFLWGFYFAKS